MNKLKAALAAPRDEAPTGFLEPCYCVWVRGVDGLIAFEPDGGAWWDIPFEYLPTWEEFCEHQAGRRADRRGHLPPTVDGEGARYADILVEDSRRTDGENRDA